MRIILTFVLLVLSGQALAQESIYDRCVAAVDDENLPKTKELAATIKRFSNYSARDLPKAEKCISYAEGTDLMFDYKSQKFQPKGQVLEKRENTAKAYQDKVKAEQALKEIERKRREALRKLGELNKTRISEGVYNACVALFNQDEISAMTNDTCIKSFSANGHPNLSLYDEAFKSWIKE